MQHLLSCSTLLAKKAVKRTTEYSETLFGDIAEAGLCGLTSVPKSTQAEWQERTWVCGGAGCGQHPHCHQGITKPSVQEYSAVRPQTFPRLYVTGSRVLTLSPASPLHCTCGSLHLFCRSTALTQPFGPLWEKSFPARAADPSCHSLTNQRAKGIYSLNNTHLLNQGCPAALVHFPEKPIKNLVLMPDLYVTIL